MACHGIWHHILYALCSNCYFYRFTRRLSRIQTAWALTITQEPPDTVPARTRRRPVRRSTRPQAHKVRLWTSASTGTTMSFVISLRGFLTRPFTIICPRYRAPGRLVFPGGAPNGYSRESTPESGGSHYMDHYRDVNGKHYNSIILLYIYCRCLYKYWWTLSFEYMINSPGKKIW